MADGGQHKMVITVDIETGKIDRVDHKIGEKYEEVRLGGQLPLAPEGGYRHIGLLLAFRGSNCVTLNMPGGGSYTVCF